MTREEIARTIRESRLATGLTQNQVAKELGRPQQTIANWESGKSQPDANTLFELFRIFGRSVDEAFGFTTRSFSVTAHEQEHIKKYRALDSHGQDAVELILDHEHKRCIEQAQNMAKEGSEPENVIYITRWFSQPMSAGTGIEAGNDYPEELELTKRPPQGTSYVAPVRGDSMEPTYHDGDKLFIRSCEEIETGQIGVFLMDGKQWVKEQGDGILISHNAEYGPIPMRENIRCQGLVLGVCDKSYLE